jgi:hypothetical protein
MELVVVGKKTTEDLYLGLTNHGEQNTAESITETLQTIARGFFHFAIRKIKPVEFIGKDVP